MRSDPQECFVWIWLPGETQPVVAGRLEADGANYVFNYGSSYLGHPNAIPIYHPELPLGRGAIPPPIGLTMASSLRDAAPDAWGRRVIINRRTGARRDDIDALSEMTYLLESGSDRGGALDFQLSASRYEPRGTEAATLDELIDVAGMVEAGNPVPPALGAALYHGSSIGGARPKALIDTAEAKYIAKFPSERDATDLVKAEYVAMRLAAIVGTDVAEVRLTKAAGKDVLLVRRFDRRNAGAGWERKAMVSALTLFGLDEMLARYASYENFCEIIRFRFSAPRKTLAELFRRLVFNILCGNTDDHARNHAAFWDGAALTLTPAYDICPQGRAGNEASQAMLIVGEQNRSLLATCLDAAPNFELGRAEATMIIESVATDIIGNYAAVAEEASMPKVQRDSMAARQFFNPSIFEGAPAAIQKLAGSLR